MLPKTPVVFGQQFALWLFDGLLCSATSCIATSSLNLGLGSTWLLYRAVAVCALQLELWLLADRGCVLHRHRLLETPRQRLLGPGGEVLPVEDLLLDRLASDRYTSRVVVLGGSVASRELLQDPVRGAAHGRHSRRRGPCHAPALDRLQRLLVLVRRCSSRAALLLCNAVIARPRSRCSGERGHAWLDRVHHALVLVGVRVERRHPLQGSLVGPLAHEGPLIGARDVVGRSRRPVLSEAGGDAL